MRLNVRIPTPPLRTHEGAVAARINVEQALQRCVMANMLWEGTFYESGVEIAQRIVDLTQQYVREKGPAGIVEMAVKARSEMKLRHVPLMLLATLAHMDTLPTRAVLADALTRTIQRPDELGEFVSMFWNGKRSLLPFQVKKGLNAALAKFNEYELAKWDSASDAVRIRDVMFLCHPKPANAAQKDLWDRLVKNELKTPDTWEVALSGGADKKEAFKRLIAEGKLGALALLRNLRNMQQAGVEESIIANALNNMKTERVLPFRFITAARYAPQLEPSLEAAMFRCLEGQEKLLGRTAILVDCSASMASMISERSELQRKDAAAALAILIREICPDVVVIPFGTKPVQVPPRRGFALRDLIARADTGGSTNIGHAVKMANDLGYERIVVVTDEQSQDAIPKPLSNRAYFVNIAAYANGIGYGPWVHIDGWSEAIVNYIVQYEKENNAK